MPKNPTAETYAAVATNAVDGETERGVPFVAVTLQLNHRLVNDDPEEWESHAEPVEQRFYFAGGKNSEISGAELIRLGVGYAGPGEYSLSGEPVRVEEYHEWYEGKKQRRFRSALPPTKPANDTSRALIGNALEVAMAKAALNATNTETPTAPPAAGAQAKDDLPF